MRDFLQRFHSWASELSGAAHSSTPAAMSGMRTFAVLIMSMLTCSALLISMWLSASRAQAVEIDDNILTDASLSSTTVAGTASTDLVMHFALPNNTIAEGDTSTIRLPEGFTFTSDYTFPVVDASDTTVANATMNAATGTLTLTYTKYVEQHSDITGSIIASIRSRSDNTAYGTQAFVIDVDGHEINAGELTHTQSTGDNPDERFAKYGWQNVANNQLEYVLRVNGNNSTMNGAVITDTLETPGTAVDPSSFAITRGTWTISCTTTDRSSSGSVQGARMNTRTSIQRAQLTAHHALAAYSSYKQARYGVAKHAVATPAARVMLASDQRVCGNYQLAGNVRDVTQDVTISVASDKRSFTIDAGDLGTEGLYIRYSVNISYTPVNHETFRNSAQLTTRNNIEQGAQSTQRWMVASGEANGYNYAVHILKTDSTGSKPLANATFALTRDRTNTQVGTLTTNSDGAAQVSGLLRDAYTLTETQAPEGYQLAAPVHISVDELSDSTNIHVITVRDEADVPPSPAPSTPATPGTPSTQQVTPPSPHSVTPSTPHTTATPQQSTVKTLAQTGNSVLTVIIVAAVALALGVGVIVMRRRYDRKHQLLPINKNHKHAAHPIDRSGRNGVTWR